MLGAALLFLYANGVLGQARDVVLAVVVAAVALGLILAPFLWRLGRNLAVERAERIRSQERAELAAHLHDSVLQTLTLMQKRADDPREVAALARRQERELRAWLFDGSAGDRGDSLAAAIEAVAAEVEDAHAVAIDVVAVGDRPLDERGAALVAATREALTNAAKFAADAGAVAVYAEMGPDRAQVFVRDRGAGLRPGDRAGGPPRRAGVDHRQDGAPRRQGDGQLGARRRDRGRAGDGGEARMSAPMPSVVIVDDHAIFRSGVRAELEGLVDVRGDVGSVEEAVRMIVRRAPRRRPARRPHARRRRGRGDPPDRGREPGAAVPRPLGLRRRRGRDRGRARRRPRLRDEDDLRPRAGRRRRAACATATPSSRPRLAGFVLDAFAGKITEAEADPELDQLTTREREVLRLIARGYLYKEIALELSISPKTVEAHVSAVLRKLQLSNRHELSRWAVERRLVD